MSNSLFQNSYYVGNAFNGILYGVELVLYVQTMDAFLHRPTKHPLTTRFFMIFNTTMLLLITIYVAVQAVFGQEMWIVNAGFDGGSAAYLASYISAWYETLGTAASIALQLMSDAFLIYRCFIVYNNLFVLIFPCILWVATLVFGILLLYYSGIPSGNLFMGLAAHVGVTYVSISIGLNVIASCMICARIAYLGLAARASRHNASQKETLRYTGTMSIIVETALLYAISGIAFAVSYGIGSRIEILFLSIYAMCTCISPQLIIMRIADGKAWKRYKPPRTSVIGLRHTSTSYASQSVDSGANTNSKLQFSSSPDSDLS